MTIKQLYKESAMSESSPSFYLEKSQDPFSVNPENHLSGEYLFHGTDEAQLSNILKQGINPDLFVKRGKSGKAFYTTTDIRMALTHAVNGD